MVVMAQTKSNAAMIVDCGAYSGGRRVRDLAFDQISEILASGSGFVWLRLFEPDAALMKRVQDRFGLHELAVEDALRAHQRPKLDAYGDSLLLVLHTAQLSKEKVEFGELYVFAGPSYVVTVRHAASPSLDPVRVRCESEPARLAQGPGAVLHAVCDFVVDHYIPVVDRLEDQLAALEEAIFARGRRARTTQELYAIKRSLTRLRRIAIPLADILDHLARAGHAIVHDDARPYYRDVVDHVMRIRERTELMREMLDAAMQVNLALISVAQNDAVRKLAGWAALLAVPTLVTSYFGMNFKHMPELEWEYGYPAVVGITIVFCLLLHRRLKRAGWL